MPTTTQQKNIAIESVSLNTKKSTFLELNLIMAVFFFSDMVKEKKHHLSTRFCVQKEGTCVLKSWYRSISTSANIWDTKDVGEDI